MTIEITRTHTKLRIENTDSGRWFVHVDKSSDFVDGWTDEELAELITERLAAMGIDGSVSASDIPTHPDTELQQAISNAADLSELKSALTDSNHAAKSRGRGPPH